MRKLLLLLFALTFALTSVGPTAAAPRQQSTYPADVDWDRFVGGCMIDGDNFCELLVGWLEENGGMPVFGLPIGEMYIDEHDNLVFPLERFRVEFHEDLIDTPYFFQIGLMGEEALVQRGRIWHNEPRAEPQPGCQYFAETGHNVCGLFLEYWQSHGREFDGRPGKSYEESLALFGYPVGEAVPEVGSDGVVRMTQWFQRARFEEHPQNLPPFNVLLGLLNSEITQESALPSLPVPAPAPDPVPVPPVADPRENCDPSYPTVCIPPPPPDLDCGDIPYRRFPVVGDDPHRFDRDRDGIGCES